MPPVIAWWDGQAWLKVNPSVLSGAVAGGRFATPALQVAQDAAGNAIPAIGYPVAYATTAVLTIFSGMLTLLIT